MLMAIFQSFFFSAICHNHKCIKVDTDCHHGPWWCSFLISLTYILYLSLHWQTRKESLPVLMSNYSFNFDTYIHDLPEPPVNRLNQCSLLYLQHRMDCHLWDSIKHKKRKSYMKLVNFTVTSDKSSLNIISDSSRYAI